MTFEHTSGQTKRQMLGRLGMTSPDSAAPIEFKKTSALVEGQTIQLWSVLVENTFSQASFFTWSPDSLYVYFHRLLHEQDDE
eukprot:4899938-Pyramimonas_sp.AAC.1